MQYYVLERQRVHEDLLTWNCTQGLEAFNKQNGEVLKSIGVSYEDVLAKGRILALLTLASQSDVLTFAAIRVSG